MKPNKKAALITLSIGIACVIASQLSGCGTNTTVTQYVPSPTVTVTASPSPSPTNAVQEVVNGYNEYLVSQGSDPIQPGLRCTLYNVPNMPANPCLSSSSISGCNQISSSTGYTAVATYTYTRTLDQANEPGTAGFNVLPTALQGLYATNFAVTCTGYLINVDYNWHSFDVSSDDGSLLYIGGSLVIQNDGLHGVQDVKGEKYLQAQVYGFQLNYFQGPGNVELIVNMDGQVLPAANLYH